MNSNGIKVPEELKKAFDELHDGQLALQYKVDAFSRTINAESHALAVSAKHTWAEAKAVMNLEGDWKYENGMVYPLTLPDMVTPNV